jgi:hypothetical protein
MLNNKEQRIKNKYGPQTGKQLFIILYSLFISLAPQAQAVKMCRYDTRGSSYFNAADGSFVVGTCPGGDGPQQACQGYSHTATYGGIGAPANYNCSSIRVAGVSKCVDDSAAGQKVCLCKLTYPKESIWIVGHEKGDGWGGIGGCKGGRTTCPEICACHMPNNTYRNTNAAIGGMI